MTQMARAANWTSAARGLHWLVALLLVAVWGAIELHHIPPKGTPWHDHWKTIHFSLGLTVLLLMILRLYWRSRHPAPAPLGNRLQSVFARLVQGLLYIVVLTMPLLGFSLRQFAGKPIDFYGLVELPQLVAPNKDIAHSIAFLHKDLLWYVLLALVALHLLGVLWHHFINRDNTLKRMIR